MMSEQESLEEWFDKEITVSKEDYINEEKNRIKQVFRYENANIIPVLKNISVPKQIMSITIGKSVANQIGKEETDIITIDELDDALDTERNNIRSNLSNLRKQNFIQKVEDEGNKLVYSKLSEILDYVIPEDNQ